MINIDWSSILPTGALISLAAMAGALLWFFACVKIGRALARARDEQSVALFDYEAIQEELDQEFAPIRRAPILRADEAARMV